MTKVKTSKNSSELPTKVKFIELNPEQITRLREIYESDSPYLEKFSKIYREFGIAQRTANQWFSDLGFVSREAPELEEAKSREIENKILFFTSAQNATKINEQMWINMKAYAKYHNAGIHVIPFRYKNPTSTFSDRKHDWWTNDIKQYLDLKRHEVCDNLVILGDLKIQPTAEFPLSGLEALTKGRSAIIGHPKMHLSSTPVLEGEHKQVLYSTGVITEPNYTDSKAGKKGDSHHTFGFVVVEIDSDDFHIRHVPVEDDGSFQDLWFSVSDGEVKYTPNIKSLVMGDLHVGDDDPYKVDASIDLSHKLSPEYLVLHDVFNGHSVNHHEDKNGVLKFYRIKNNRHLISTEIEEMVGMLNFLNQELPKTNIVVVRSNHDEFLDRYVLDKNWVNDPANADMYAKCLSYLLSNEDNKGLIPWFINQELPEIICLGRDQSFRPLAHQLANHGDIGVNGTKGTPLQYSRFAAKQITGHTHCPARINGLMVVGTSTKLRVGYNVGPSSWRHADVIEYNNGNATHIIYNEKYQFTTFKFPE